MLGEWDRSQVSGAGCQLSLHGDLDGIVDIRAIGKSFLSCYIKWVSRLVFGKFGCLLRKHKFEKMGES
jgi:hypothetical protein